MWRNLVVAVLAMCIATPIAAKDAKDVIADVGREIGSTNVRSITYSATGYFFFVGQHYRATDAWPKFTLKGYTRTLDYENAASEEKLVMAQFEKGERGGGFIPVEGELTQGAFLSGEYAWTVGGAPALDFNAPFLTEARQVEMALTPDGWVRSAMASNPEVATQKVGGKPVTIVSFLWKGKYKVVAYVNQHNELEKIETWLPQPILGDMLVEMDYSDYRDFSGVKFPTRIVEKEGAFPVLDLNVTDVQVNMPVNIRVPDAVRNAPPPPAAVRVVSQKLGDGVWLLRAGTQSLGVEFKDYVAIVEGAGNEARSLAVIAEMKRLVPDKPVKYVINTHHHLDHSGGLRTFVAEGATIITAQENKAYFEKIFKMPHSLDPDELAKSPKPATYITVNDKYVLTDGDQSIELYSLPDNTHSTDFLLVYVPRIKAVIEGDIYNPAAAPLPGAPAPQSVNLVGSKEFLRDNLQRLKLNVEFFVGIHGNGTTPFADLDKEIQIEHQQLQQLETAGK